MSKFVLLLTTLVTAACTSPQKAGQIDLPELLGTDVHMHTHRNGGDDMQYDGARITLALEAAHFERGCILSHSFNRQNNPICWKTNTKKCNYDANWVRETNKWTFEEAKKFPQLIVFCGIEVGADINTATELIFCREQSSSFKLRKNCLRRHLSSLTC